MINSDFVNCKDIFAQNMNRWAEAVLRPVANVQAVFITWPDHKKIHISGCRHPVTGKQLSSEEDAIELISLALKEFSPEKWEMLPARSDKHKSAAFAFRWFRQNWENDLNDFKSIYLKIRLIENFTCIIPETGERDTFDRVEVLSFHPFRENY